MECLSESSLMETNGRIEEVDIMRGIGIILVAIGHMGINSAYSVLFMLFICHSSFL